MAKSEAYWEFEGGYTELLQTATLVGKLVAGPTRQELRLTPAALFREKGTPVELEFELLHRVAGGASGGLSWELLPHLRMRVALLAPGSSYVGNHKVPDDSFGVQWTVDSRVTGDASWNGGEALVAAEAGTRLSQIWVECFKGTMSTLEAVTQAWKRFSNPFNASAIGTLQDGQLVRWNWSGSSSLSFEVDWEMTNGWQLGRAVGPIEGLLKLRSLAGLQAGITLSRRGAFSLTIKRRGKTVAATLRRERSRETEVGFGVRARLATGVGLRSGADWLTPLLKPIQRGLRKAIARKAEIAVGVAEARWSRRKAVLYATFNLEKGSDLQKEYARFLRGRIAPRRPGVSYRGSFAAVQGKRLALDFEIFDWVRFNRSTEIESNVTVDVTPDGTIRIERGMSLDKSSYRGDETTFFRIVASELLSTEPVSTFDWTSGWEGRVSRHRLHFELAAALHVGALDEFTLPGRLQEGGHVRLVWQTRFSRQGLETVRSKEDWQWWEAVVKSLELADPERYSIQSYWRDWIDSEEVRQLIREDPVNAHLNSNYPVPGRTDFQRRQVVTEYRRVRRFLSVCEAWKEGDTIKAFEPSLGLPLFLWFHLLCPAELRRSALATFGAMNLSWGDADLLAELQSV